MPQYAKMNGDPPKIFTSDHFNSWDQAMQQLAIANWVISKCEKCGMPVEAMRAECDGLCSFYEGLNAEWRGPQAQNPEVLKS